MRRTLLAILLISLALPAAAQPWAPEAARNAGRQALAAAQAGRYDEAEALARTADPVARKLVTWTRMHSRGSGASGAEIAGWLAENPDWPLPETTARRAEEALATDPDDALVLRHFARIPPRGVEAAQRHADALARAGRGAEATPMLRGAWRDGPPADPAAEAAFLERFAAQLTADDHWRRFDRLLWENQAAAAARVMPRLDGNRRATAEARLAARSNGEINAGAATRDIGVAYATARQLRQADRDSEAAAVWAAAEPLQRDLSPEAARAIWAERQILARKLLRQFDARSAYRLVANHGQTEPGEPRQEAEFLAGFIALRRLNDAATAQRHFARVDDGSRSVITRARSAYWEGLALAALNRPAEARARWEQGAALPVAFYGQLSSRALGETPAQLSARIGATTLPEPPAEVARNFGARELSRAAVTLGDLGQSDRARVFLLRMEELSPDATDRWLIARLAVLMGRPDHAVWVARRAGADGVILLEDGWPTPYPTPSSGAEAAVVNAITRQESNFELTAVSRANARGPMQLLPATASGVARRLGIPHSTAMLTSDAAHNLRLGSAYIAERLDRYAGALPLAAAAYNAGAGRVDQWVEVYGDPRAPGGPDIRDWIELIPFSETRNYVQRVIENVVVYRARNPATGDMAHPLETFLAGRP
ncbi:transglycosylase [Falsiroseomonas bella]|uniref:Transglycosylase n=1 Tax=Falsiroseomonas bella TaxID=2184016 RepID=A0A317FE71_9PROT|nr:lytic transglycosylase domain-containing protein [Falsiroseomonas bella]PWS36843.1 transglycosylase [Falsiroseomonas bella]